MATCGWWYVGLGGFDLFAYFLVSTVDCVLG